MNRESELNTLLHKTRMLKEKVATLLQYGREMMTKDEEEMYDRILDLCTEILTKVNNMKGGN